MPLYQHQLPLPAFLVSIPAGTSRGFRRPPFPRHDSATVSNGLDVTRIRVCHPSFSHLFLRTETAVRGIKALATGWTACVIEREWVYKTQVDCTVPRSEDIRGSRGFIENPRPPTAKRCQQMSIVADHTLSRHTEVKVPNIPNRVITRIGRSQNIPSTNPPTVPKRIRLANIPRGPRSHTNTLPLPIDASAIDVGKKLIPAIIAAQNEEGIPLVIEAEIDQRSVHRRLNDPATDVTRAEVDPCVILA